MTVDNRSETRIHSSDDMGEEFERLGFTHPVGVIIRPDNSIDVYGYVAVIDQRLPVAEQTLTYSEAREALKHAVLWRPR